MPNALRTMMFLAGPVAAIVAACSSVSVTAPGSGTGGSCDGTDTAGPCQGSFSCGNSGMQMSCDRATSVCVVTPGQVRCEVVAGASASRCPTPSAAQALAGCTTPFKPSCSGTAGSGITVSCVQ